MRNLAKRRGGVERMIGVYCGKRRYRFDEVEVWPVEDFAKALFNGEVS